MVKGMVMDLDQNRFETFDELYVYCYRVAGTGGLMVLPIMGTAEDATLEEALEPALALGVALQLTNILRDVGEDRGRCSRASRMRSTRTCSSSRSRARASGTSGRRR